MRRQQPQLKTLDNVRPDGNGKRYSYWLLRPGLEGYIVGDLGMATEKDCKYGRIAVRERAGRIWYMLCPDMHATQHAHALIRSQQ